MAVTILSTTTIGAGPHFTYAAADDELIILPGVTIGATTGDAIADNTSLDNVTLTLMGTIAGTNGQRFGGLWSTFHIVAGGAFISTEGVAGNAAVFLTGAEETFINDGSFSASNSIGILSVGGNSIINTGSMQAASPLLLGLNGPDDRFINSGTVTSNHSADASQSIRYNNAVLAEAGNIQITNLASGTLTAVASEGAGVRFNNAAGGSSLSNSGEIISAQDFGVNLGTVSVGQAQIKVSNWGVISGADGAYNGSVNDDLLANRGQLVGDVAMGLGLDTVDNRFGGVIEGNVYLGDGNDKYVGDGGRVVGAVDGGAGADFFFGNEGVADIFIGGDGIDTLDFRLGKAAILALDGSFAQDGAALGDTYSQIENVFGSEVGDDVIRGNAGGNALFGWGGNDSLDGANGVDVLRGGTGQDTLTGGGGNDVFRYQAVSELGDVITDFGNNVSSNDSFQFILSGFAAAGLSAGVLAANQFQTRTDNVAQDADDRFIFNTTDRTLWYDVDGTGGAAALLVADLQAGAVVTASDMILI